MGSRANGMLVVAMLVAAGLLALAGHDQSGTGTPPGDARQEAVRDLAAIDLDELLGGITPSFTQNTGQVANPDVRYYAQGDPMSVGLTPWGAIFTLNEGESGLRASLESVPTVRTASFSVTFEGCGGSEPRGVSELGHRISVFKGRDPAGWAAGLRSYGEVVYDDLYPGVDLRFHFKDGMLKYDLAVVPGADVGSIVMRYDGLSDLSINDATGNLVLETGLGAVSDARPVVLQDGPDGTLAMPGEFRLVGDRLVGFTLPEGCSRDRPLVIDPGLVFCTFLGGSEGDLGRGIEFDAQGNIVIAGPTYSTDFPSTPGSYDNTSSGTIYDADIFVTKLNPTCSELVWGTFIGGLGMDDCISIRLSDEGDIVGVGYTLSQDFPVVDPFGEANGPHELGNDVLVFRLSADGSSLDFSAIFGGEDNDGAESLEILDDGSVVIAGVTQSTDFPTTQGAYCETRGWIPNWDFFVMRINGSYDSLDFSTYIGGSGRDGLASSGTLRTDMAIDGDGTIYIHGTTNSDDFPITPGVLRPKINASEVDTVVTALDPTGSTLLRSTYFGGWREDQAFTVAVAENGSVVVGGATTSTDLEVTSDALRPRLPSPAAGYLAILTPDLTEIQYCTYLGGAGGERTEVQSLGWSLDGGILYALCRTDSNVLETTFGTHDSRWKWGADYYLLGLWATNRTIEYATYITGSDVDGGTDIVRDMIIGPDGAVYVVGITWSEDFPVTPGAYSTEIVGEFDAFVLKLDPRPCTEGPSAPTNLTATAGNDVVELTWDVPSPVGSRVVKHYVYWGYSPSSLSNRIEVTKSDCGYDHFEVFNGITYYYRVSAVNGVGEGPLSNMASAKPLGPATAPRGLTLRNERGVIHVNWSLPERTGGEIDGYHLLRACSGEAGRTFDIAADELEYNDTEVCLGTQYSYKVRAFNSIYNGTWSDPRTITPRTIPGPPVDLVATPGDRQVGLVWKTPDSDGASAIINYEVHYGMTDETMVLYATVPWTNHSLLVTGLENTETYYFCVFANNNEGQGPPSGTVQVVPRGPPLAPRNLVATVGDGKVALSWAEPLSDGGYAIYEYRVFIGPDEENLRLSATVGVVTSHTVPGLTNGVTYYFQVCAVNEFGMGPRTDTREATPSGPPGTVINLITVESTNKVKLMWQLPGETGGLPLTKIRIYRGPYPDEVELYKELGPTVEDYTDFDVVAGATYYYTVVAMSLAGEGKMCDCVPATPYDVPDPPTGVTATPGDGRVTIRWTPPERNGGRPVEGYTIFRGQTGISFRVLVELGNVMVYIDTEVVNDQTYYYQVKAVNEAGMSAESETKDATPGKLVDVPDRPQGLSVEVVGASARLKWSSPLVDGGSPVTGYVIKRGLSPTNMSEVGKVGNIHSYTDSGLDYDTAYYYCVVAKNLAGEGPATEPVVAKVGPKEKKEGPGPAAMGALASIGVAWALAGRRRRSRRPV